MLDVPVNYREYAAKGVIETLRKVGVMILIDGPRLRAYPQRVMRKYPGLVHMVDRYRPELVKLLDAEVE